MAGLGYFVQHTVLGIVAPDMLTAGGIAPHVKGLAFSMLHDELFVLSSPPL